jgi:hypothetical protein
LKTNFALGSETLNIESTAIWAEAGNTNKLKINPITNPRILLLLPKTVCFPTKKAPLKTAAKVREIKI